MTGARTSRSVLAALLLATVTACDSGAPSAAPTATRIPEPTPVSITYELGTKVWYEGLVITFDRVTSTLDARGGPVELLVGVQNPGAEDSEFDGGITLVVGTTRLDPTRESRIPTVPATGSLAVVLTYELQQVASIETAVFEVGVSPLHVAKVPVTPVGGPAVTFEPVDLEVGGSVTAGPLKVTFRAATLRWDLPDWSEELDDGLQVVTLTYDATYVGDFAGGFAFTGGNVALRLPDGTVVNARRDGHSQSVELIGPHKTKRGLTSRFEIPAGVPGDYQLVVKSGPNQRTITFTIGG